MAGVIVGIIVPTVNVDSVDSSVKKHSRIDEIPPVNNFIIYALRTLFVNLSIT